jgi:hypothetical protein
VRLVRSSLLLAALSAAACGDQGASIAIGTFRSCRGRPVSPPQAQGWRHTSTSILVTPAGAANHSAQDLLTPDSVVASLGGKFAYGTISRDLEDEDVRVLLDTCDGWRDLGVHATSSDGRVTVPVGVALGPGVYEARLQVLGDGSGTVAFLWVLPAGTRVTLTDIDGTMTESDSELFLQVLDGSHVPVPYPGAVDLTAAHAERGWLVVYLTGRPYWLMQVTRDWLSTLAFAPGPLHVTDSNDQALPTESGVGEFKRLWIGTLTAQGYLVDVAYGNAATDIYAYLGAGLPSSRVWIIGANGGTGGTHAVEGTWEPRAAEVQSLPVVEQPFNR